MPREWIRVEDHRWDASDGRWHIVHVRRLWLVYDQQWNHVTSCDSLLAAQIRINNEDHRHELVAEQRTAWRATR